MSNRMWANLFCVLVLMLSGTLFCTWLEKATMQKQAIERGYAEYAVKSNGKTTWQWKEEDNE